MIDFDVKCPKNYPLKCNLLDVEKEKLVRSETYKGFLMYQFKDQRDYLVLTVKEYFKSPTYYLYDARVEPGLGVKICKICRLALASDFGIASITPLNFNVFLEVGMMLGLGKPVVYLVDKNFEHEGDQGAKAIPFDLSDQIVIAYDSAEELSQKLEREIPVFIDKVQLSSTFEKDFVQSVKNKLSCLDDDRKNVLKFFVLEQSEEIRENWLPDMLRQNKVNIRVGIKDVLNDLHKIGFIKRWKSPHQPGIARHDACVLEEGYRQILKDLLFKDISLEEKNESS